MNSNFKKQAACMLALLLLSTLSFSQNIYWCPKVGITGYENEAIQAKSVLSPPNADFNQMEVFVTTKGDKLYLHSNYKPDGAGFPYKLSVDKSDELPPLEWLVKYLTDPNGVNKIDETFTIAFRNHMKLHIDPVVFSHPSFGKMDFNNINQINIVSGTSSYPLENLPALGNKAAVKVRERTYVKLIPDKGCEIADKISKLKAAIEYINRGNDHELGPEDLKTDVTEQDFEEVSKQTTFTNFLNSAASNGFTLVETTCSVQEKLDFIVFDVYKPKDYSDVLFARMEKLGQVEVKYEHSEESVDNEDSKDESGGGLGVFWYVVIGIIILIIIGSFVNKD